MAWSQYKRIMDANTQHRDKNEQPWGTEFSKGVREVVGMIPEDNPVINTVGAALGGFADQWSQTTPGRMEDAALDWVGKQAPKINVDSLAAQMAVGMFLPGPGELGVANRAVKASKLGKRSLFNVQDTIGLNPPPVRTGELGPFPKNRAAGGPLITKQQDLLKSKDQLKLERKDFTKTYNIATQGPLKHHHKFDQYIGARVSNRTDSPRLLQMLEVEEGIQIGDKAQNVIGLADQKTYLRRTSAMESVSKQMGFRELPKTGTTERRLLDDLFKETKSNQKFVTPKDPASYGLPRGEPTGTNTWAIGLNPDGSKVTNAQKLAAYDNRFAYNKIDKSKIKYDRGGTIVSGDHIDLTHYTGIESKDFTQRTELINLLESGDHLKLSTRQLKDKVTEVYRIQENIAVNVAVRRMNFIKDFVKNSGKIPPATRDMLLRDPNKLRQWIVNNPGISGNIGWKLKKPSFKELSKPPSSRHLKEWRDGQSPLQIIFGKGASISRPKGWEAPATARDLKILKQSLDTKL